ncbi:DUF6153 family protein [Nonomuraea sp. NPDC050790]|uniref:DUF6153 family protein n=1 Tax=Nonomuraea sp. NPDC050790 TaxID=3364371 RepID=UPI003797BE57
MALRLGRLLLLVLLVVGVCGMHTLGHLSHGEPHAVAVQAPVAVDQDDGLPGMDPGVVCLAVLTSMVFLLLALVWAGTLPSPLRAVRRFWRVRGVARAPPRLAELSVMRI